MAEEWLSISAGGATMLVMWGYKVWTQDGDEQIIPAQHITWKCGNLKVMKWWQPLCYDEPYGTFLGGFLHSQCLGKT